MISGDEQLGDNSQTSVPASRTFSRGSTPRQQQGPANRIEFVDSQDPNIKSAIQRHTAYHSAAQRREARLTSLRRGAQPRFLEWSRRPGSESSLTSPASSINSQSITPSNPDVLAQTQVLSGTELETGLPGHRSVTPVPTSRPNSPRVPLSPQEEATLQAYLSTACGREQYHVLQSSVVSFIRTDEASTLLLLAYCHAILANVESSRELAAQERQHAQRYFGRGTNLLWNRLRDSTQASSDVNIQAVLLLVAYTCDSGEADEVEIHAEALRTMVAQRGGTGGISNAVLRGQLEGIQASRRDHLTLVLDHEQPAKTL